MQCLVRREAKRHSWCERCLRWAGWRCLRWASWWGLVARCGRSGSVGGAGAEIAPALAGIGAGCGMEDAGDGGGGGELDEDDVIVAGDEVEVLSVVCCGGLRR